MHGPHQTLFVAEVFFRRFHQIPEDGLLLGRIGAREDGLVQFVTEAIKRTVLGVNLREVDRMGTAPFERAHPRYSTKFKSNGA